MTFATSQPHTKFHVSNNETDVRKHYIDYQSSIWYIRSPLSIQIVFNNPKCPFGKFDKTSCNVAGSEDEGILFIYAHCEEIDKNLFNTVSCFWVAFWGGGRILGERKITHSIVIIYCCLFRIKKEIYAANIIWIEINSQRAWTHEWGGKR